MTFWFLDKYWGMSLEGFSFKSSLQLLYGEWSIFNMNGPGEPFMLNGSALSLNEASQPPEEVRLGDSDPRASSHVGLLP